MTAYCIHCGAELWPHHQVCYSCGADAHVTSADPVTAEATSDPDIPPATSSANPRSTRRQKGELNAQLAAMKIEACPGCGTFKLPGTRKCHVCDYEIRPQA